MPPAKKVAVDQPATSQAKFDSSAPRELKPAVCSNGQWEIIYVGGGVLPTVLQGRFTSHHAAQQHITAYKMEKDKR